MDATVDEGDATIGFGGDFFAVGNEYNSCFFAAGELGDQIDNHGAGGGVEIAGGFVGEKDGWLVDQGAGEGGPLELASGKLMRPVMRAIAQADGGEKFTGTGMGRGVHPTGEEEGKENVFFDREGGEEVEELENKADSESSECGQFVVVKGVEGVSFEIGLARRGGVEGSEDMKESTFSAAAGAGDGNDFTWEDFESDAT